MSVRVFRYRGKNYRAPLGQLALGGVDRRDWYERSKRSVREYAHTQQLNPEYVASVVAILSPRVSVDFNVKLADEYCRTGKASGAMGARVDALDKYERTGVFSGPKVNAFKLALLGDSRACVIDSWMYRVAGDERYPGKLAYIDACDRVRACAEQLGWPIAETQAAIWTGVRRLVGFPDVPSLTMPGVSS